MFHRSVNTSEDGRCAEATSDACEQVTAFVALLALDQRRVEAGRLDIAPCARLPALLSLARKVGRPLFLRALCVNPIHDIRC